MTVAVNDTVVFVPDGVVLAPSDTAKGADVWTKTVVTAVPTAPLLSVAVKVTV